MKNLLFTFLLITAFFLSSKADNNSKPINNIPQDIHSFARPDEAIIKHLELDLTVDFNKKILSGKAVLTIENKTGTDTLHLDSRDLNITKVTLDDNSQSLFTKSTSIK